jgi:hypothetical protein
MKTEKTESKQNSDEIIDKLKLIADPIGYFKSKAEEQGNTLDSVNAVKLSDDAYYLRGKAQEALDIYNSQLTESSKRDKDEINHDIRNESNIMGFIESAKEAVALRNGYNKDVYGSAWKFAMISTHRTKKQIELYEEVIKEITSGEYRVLDWISGDTTKFHCLNEAEKQYEFFMEGEEVDVMMFKVIQEFRNITI